jgi:hypothetical protein
MQLSENNDCLIFPLELKPGAAKMFDSQYFMIPSRSVSDARWDSRCHQLNTGAALAQPRHLSLRRVAATNPQFFISAHYATFGKQSTYSRIGSECPVRIQALIPGRFRDDGKIYYFAQSAPGKSQTRIIQQSLSSILSDGMLDTAVCQTPKMPVAAS